MNVKSILVLSRSKVGTMGGQGRGPNNVRRSLQHTCSQQNTPVTTLGSVANWQHCQTFPRSTFARSKTVTLVDRGKYYVMPLCRWAPNLPSHEVLYSTAYLITTLGTVRTHNNFIHNPSSKKRTSIFWKLNSPNWWWSCPTHWMTSHCARLRPWPLHGWV